MIEEMSINDNVVSPALLNCDPTGEGRSCGLPLWLPCGRECEDEWSEVQERFKKEGLDFDVLGSEERLLHVWRWLVDAESNLHSSRRQLDKLRDLQSEEMEVSL
uniref:Uncharacterized protein n=1 Tax=Timema douglasi TaxID=61478 RepID=A0A7R8VVW8_TIMDO|nr:unnamed protein product [Timema douglasi]